MSVDASPIIPPNTNAVDDDLWGVPSIFAADWKTSVRVNNQFTTDVKFAQSMRSSREGLRGKPRRLITASILGLQGAELSRLRAAMFRQTQARSLCPIFCDQTFLTANAAAGQPVLLCSTLYRRFYVGAIVLVCQTITSGTGEITTYEVHHIDTVASGSLTLTANLAGAFAAGARIYPLIEGKTVLRPEIDLETETIANWLLSVQEEVGPSQLPALEAANANPAGFAVDPNTDLPILSVRCDWKIKPRLGAERAEYTATSGIADISQMKGLRAVVTGSLSFDFIERKDAWDFKRFWDSRRGRLFPFMLPLPTFELNLLDVNVGVSDIIVTKIGVERDWFFHQFVCFELYDGSLVFLKIATWEDLGDGRDYVQFTTGNTLTIGDVRRCTFGIVACFDADDFSEEWGTDETMSTSLNFREYPFDGDIDLGIVDPRTLITRPPAGPGPGSPGNPPPLTKTYCTLRDCLGNVLNVYIPADPAPPERIFSGGVLYTVDCTLEITGTPPGPVLGGWEEVPFPFGDPSNPSWVPACDPECPATKVVSIAGATPDPRWNGDWTVVQTGTTPATYEGDVYTGPFEHGWVSLVSSGTGWIVSMLFDFTGERVIADFKLDEDPESTCPPDGSYPIRNADNGFGDYTGTTADVA